MKLKTTRSGLTRSGMAILAGSAIGGFAACNLISGANDITVTSSSSSTTSGGGMDSTTTSGGGMGGSAGMGSITASTGTTTSDPCLGVTCKAPDACHTAGVCDNGACSKPPATMLGTPCMGGLCDGNGSCQPSSTTLACKSGDVAVGMVGRAGGRVDRVGLVCAPLMPNGDPGAGTYTVGPVGGVGGSDFGLKNCPPSEVIVQILTSVSDAVNQITLGCQAPAVWKAQGAVDQNIDANSMSPSSSAGLFCTGGSLVHAVDVSTGLVGPYLVLTDFKIAKPGGCQ